MLRNTMGSGLILAAVSAGALAVTGAAGADAGLLDAEPAPATVSSEVDAPSLEPTERPEREPLTADESHPERFGAIRSAEARAFGACMRSNGGGHEARTACASVKPGPAHRNPAHPGRGPDGAKEGRGNGRGAGGAEG